MSTPDDTRIRGEGNHRAFRAWDHLTVRLSEAFPRNVRNGERIVLRVIHSNKLPKRR